MKKIEENTSIVKIKVLKNPYNAFVCKTMLITVMLIVFFIAIIVIIDPFYHYHTPIEPLKVIAEKQAYQNIGMAKHIEYDSLITGSSMTENFKVSQFNKLYDCNTIKLSFSGARAENYRILFDAAFSEKKIKNVFMGLDIDSFIHASDSMTNKIPKYLYDNNWFTDTEYVLNKTVMINYALNSLNKSINNEIKDWDEIYTWYQNHQFSEQTVMKSYNRPSKRTKKGENIFEENLNASLSNIEKYIYENPETQFHMFLPPYSIVYYDYWNQRGELEAFCNAYEIIIKRLIQYPNVKLSAFYAEQDIICNLDNYKDYTHYSNKINELIANKMKSGEYELNQDNAQEYIDTAKKFFMNYDYDKLFN